TWDSTDLRPVLRTVVDTQNLYIYLSNAIYDNIGERRKDQFASALDTSGAAKAREFAELAAALMNCGCNPCCNGSIVSLDSTNDAIKVAAGGFRPADLHQEPRMFFSSLPTCSWSMNSPRSAAATPALTASMKRESSSR